MYLFVCLNHFYSENNKGSLFFFFFFFLFCNENKVIIVVAINRQSSYSSFGSKVNLYDGQLFIPSYVRIMKLTAVSS